MNKKETKSGAAFYIALCCCVGVIGLVGYIGRIASEKDALPDASNASAKIQAVQTDAPDTKPIPTDIPAATAAPKSVMSTVQASAKMKQPTAVPDRTPQPTAEAVVFSLPCKGAVIKHMSADELEYNSFLGDWRTHGGVDIALNGDEPVTAIHSGVVCEIFDGSMGETVIVDCKNGFTAVYSCLSGTDCVSVGQELSAGDRIGQSGSVGSEALREAHLHLELFKDGNAVNPCDYIIFNS